MRERRVEQVAPAALEARRADPGAHARALGLEQLVEVARRDEARARDPLGPERRVAEVRLDVRLDREQDLGTRAQPLRLGRRAVADVEAADHVERRSGRAAGTSSGGIASLLERGRELAQQLAGSARQARRARRW